MTSSAAERESWERDGFVIVRAFAERAVLDAMEARIVELVRTADAGGSIGSAYVVPELALADREPAEARTSKVFRVHRDEPIFREFAERPALLDRIEALLGPDLDCFLSQFIFKRPGALGQPWHQDSFYFRFDRGPQLGLWLAVTEATHQNGCLHVVPGSHHEAVHTHVPDRRPGANYGYVEIVDHDMSSAIPVEMKPGDLLVFHSHLMHRSTDNQSSRLRAAMVYHLAEAGTVDRDAKPVPINDWLAVRRGIGTRIDIEAAS